MLSIEAAFTTAQSLRSCRKEVDCTKCLYHLYPNSYKATPILAVSVICNPIWGMNVSLEKPFRSNQQSPEFQKEKIVSLPIAGHQKSCLHSKI
jgi:hypothetical protein